jgi:hypothetical protein
MDDASGLLRPSRVERGADMERCFGMGAAMPAHEKIKRMGVPAATPGTEALAVKGCRQISIGGQATSAQLVEQKANCAGAVGEGRCVFVMCALEDGERRFSAAASNIW